MHIWVQNVPSITINNAESFYIQRIIIYFAKNFKIDYSKIFL